jgi:hypothetical protein
MTPVQKLAAKRRTAHRSFRLVVEPDAGEQFGVRIEETNGSPDRVLGVAARIRPDQLRRLTDPLIAALRSSGHQPAMLTSSRRAPVLLDEQAGVRLAIATRAVEQVNKTTRAHAILEGLASMSDEEILYWWAKITHPIHGTRALRALRILLADDGRTGLTS